LIGYIAMQQKQAAALRGLDRPREQSWPGSLLPGTTTRARRRAAAPRAISLALQGGGSFGAFTWGVLDRLLEDETIALDAISGASAGAVNAVVLADGLAAGGREAARAALERVWRRLSNAAPLAPFGQLGQGMAASATSAIELSAQLLSPYQLNPFGLNPLRDILADEVDFARLRAGAPVRLLIAATRVRDGRVRLFRDDEITLDAVLASTCLPLLHHAITIEGEWYWDGGYSANPPLRQLVIDTKANDIVLVQLTPEGEDGVPHLSPDIARRLREIAFNGPLQKEIEALGDLAELCKGAGLFRSRFCRKLQRLRLHRIAAEESVDDLHRTSALALDWPFLTRLKESGRAAAAEWLARPPQGT
jgi:NTE family protein